MSELKAETKHFHCIITCPQQEVPPPKTFQKKRNPPKNNKIKQDPHHPHFTIPARTPPCLHPRPRLLGFHASHPQTGASRGARRSHRPPASGTDSSGLGHPPPDPSRRHPTAATRCPRPAAPGDSAAAAPTGSCRSPAAATAPGSPHRPGEAPPGDARPAPGRAANGAAAGLRAHSRCRCCL